MICCRHFDRIAEGAENRFVSKHAVCFIHDHHTIRGPEGASLPYSLTAKDLAYSIG